MAEEILLGVAFICFLGVAAQWSAWRLGLPSILVLLLFGFLAGPATGLLKPDAIFGEFLFPLVSISVAIILFEGGLSLRFAELPGLRRVIFSLISIGLLATWIVASWAAIVILELDFPLAILLGAILTVSGPTVVGPLLMYVRPKPPLGEILKWEGILVDPFGALCAVLVFDAILVGKFYEAPAEILPAVFLTIVIGSSFGIIAAILIRALIRRHLIPELLQNYFSLASVVVCYAVANHFSQEAGLFAVTVLGIVLANMRDLHVREILEFKEHLKVLILSSLFIMLAARIELSDIAELNFQSSLLFVLVLIFFARPVSVILSTVGSRMTLAERVFLSAVYPRGIVAAAVSSLFALKLVEVGYQDADLVASYTFLAIVTTVAFSSLFAGPLARLLGVAQRQPQGVLFLGANSFARSLASALQDLGFAVLLVDTNAQNILDARNDSLPCHHGNILSENAVEDLDLDGIGRLAALTPNHEANSLAAVRLTDVFERSEVYQLPTIRTDGPIQAETIPEHLRGRYLFNSDADFFDLELRWMEGARIETVDVSEDGLGEFDTQLPLVLITEEGRLEMFTTDRELTPKEGQKVVALCKKS